MMSRCIILVVVLVLLPAVSGSQQLLVFPAVTDGVSGVNDSLWLTMVRVVKLDPRDEVTVRRAWVCMPGGGLVDEPGEAPTWSLPWGHRVLVDWGDELLAGAETAVGAVGLEVEGGEVLAHAHVADILRGEYDHNWGFGTGQLIPAMEEPLQGPSHIPWLGGCRNMPCSRTPPEKWEYLRNNIGIVNPNPVPLTVIGTVIPFVRSLNDGLPGYQELYDTDPELFERTVPAFGWLQFQWVATRNYDSSPFDVVSPPRPGFVISLTPDRDVPYYAYASVVFSPDPDSGVPMFSDPMFVPARPGYVAPIAEVIPPP